MKQPDKTVSPIFDTSRLSPRCPGHDLPEGMSVDSVAVIGSEDRFRNASGVLEMRNDIGEFSIVVTRLGKSERLPVFLVKLDPFGRQELLEGPASCKP